MNLELSKNGFIHSIALIAAFILTGISSSLSAKERSANIEYSFQRKDSTSLFITVSFEGNQTGITLLHLPNNWASEKQLYRAISCLKVLSKGQSLDSTNKPDEYVVKYSPNTRVELSYVLSKDWKGVLEYPLYFRPVIEAGHFYFEGYSGLVYPDSDDRGELTCRISYKGFSANDFIGNSFFSNDSTALFKTTIGNLRNGVYCGGKFRSKQITTGDQKIVIAITGQYAFSDEDAYANISNIIIHERELWKDKSSPYFFTVLLATNGHGNSGGTAHYNSFSLFQSSNIKLTEGVSYTISHEYFHTWLGQGLRSPQPDELYKWFSEGFTDYYAYKVQYSIGLLSKTDFLNKINAKLKDYYSSPYSTLDNQQLIGHYWENSGLKDLSYRRGLAIAFALDIKIQDNGSESLNNLLRELYKKSAPRMVFSKSLFDQLVEKYAGAAMLVAINSANKGINTDLTNMLTGSKLYKVEIRVIDKIFDLGFDFEASKKAKKITGLKHGSNAEKAGLTENMDITNNFSFFPNDPEKPAKVQVINNGEKKVVEYMPAAPASVKVPQVDIGNR